MAQAGYTPISLYYSTTAAAVPLAANLAQGELAINIADGKLYYENSSGAVTLLASAAGASGDVVGPASATDNAVARFDGTTGKLIQNGVVIIGDTGAVTGVTDLTASGAVTLSGGTANGVAYLNGSKVVTSGSALVFDGSNLGLGVTPSAWSAYKAFQMQAGSLISFSTNDWRMVQNVVRTGTTLDYLNNGRAHMYLQDGGSGGHVWYNAPSGTAGNAITFTQTMTLDASGNLILGGTTARTRLTLQAGEANAPSLGTASGGAFFGNSSVSYGTLFGTSGSGYGWIQQQRVDGSATAYDLCLQPSGGNLLVGTTSAGGNGFTLYPTGSGGGVYTIYNRPATSNTTTALDFKDGGTTVGSISYTNTVTSFNTTSDQRLKENITDADSASTLIDALQVRKFDWKADGSHQRYGFVAQELVTVAPEAVHQPEDTEQMMAVDYSKLVPMLVKEIQSLRQRVAQLESN